MQATSTAAAKATPARKPVLVDAGTTVASPAKGPRNFGHRLGQDGYVRASQDGQSLVWADNGKRLSIHQLAAMPQAQRQASLKLLKDQGLRQGLGHQVAMHGQAERATRPAPAPKGPSAAQLARRAELPPRPAIDPTAKRDALVPEAKRAMQAEPGPVATASAYWEDAAKAGGFSGVVAQGLHATLNLTGMDDLEADAQELGARSGVGASASSYLVPLAKTAWDAKAFVLATLGL